MTTSVINYINEFNTTNNSGINWFQNFSYFRFNEDGSFTVKREEPFTYDEEGLIWDLINESSLDFVICGEDGCISNFDMYTPLYNFMTGMMYCIPYSKQEEYSQMMEVTIYGREVDEDELMEIMEFINK